ncbi:MAG: hypothetical protein HY755_11920 [Nitrospirae bacterium]|nr:hypothetical protein [Nitrospirota bacterium]
MEKVKVFLDSNVVFSICWSGKEKSRSYLLYELQKMGFFDIFISRLVHDETKFNLEIKRVEAIPFFEELIRHSTIIPDIASSAGEDEAALLPDNDRIIFSSAVFHRMDFFLTGNRRDYSRLYHKKISRTIVLTPADFLNKRYL